MAYEIPECTEECTPPYVPTPPPIPAEQTCIAQSAKQRITLTSTHVLHTIFGSDARCVDVKVERVVRCTAGCDLSEFVYCWPVGCPVALLPPGTYDISIPAQSAYPLESGTIVDVTVLLEPVGSDYVTALSTMNGSATGCSCCD